MWRSTSPWFPAYVTRTTTTAPFDKHKWVRGGVKNSLARWNSVFADEAIAADLINKQGTANALQ
jgi:hypothetical protein